MLRVSFYSYKGGAGRSTTSWNTIERLVRLLKPTPKEPFVIVDTDTESAGSTLLYKAKNSFLRDMEYHSVQKRMIERETFNLKDPSDGEKESFFKKMCPVGALFGTVSDAVLLIGVNMDKQTAKDADTTGEGANSKEQLDSFMNIKRACRSYGAKALFYDTPAGTQYLARHSVLESEIIVCCMRPTSQFREGTRDQLIFFIGNDIEKNAAGKRKYILTPTAVCVDSGQLFGFGAEKALYPKKALEDIKRQFDSETLEGDEELKSEFRANIKLDMLETTPKEARIYDDSEDNLTVFGIPEIKRFKWFEECVGVLPESELSANDKMAVNRYEYLAQTILKYHKIK